METLDRITTEKPDFFKKLQKYASLLAVVAGALLTASASGTIELSETLNTILVVVTTIAGTGAVGSQLPNK